MIRDLLHLIFLGITCSCLSQSDTINCDLQEQTFNQVLQNLEHPDSGLISRDYNENLTVSLKDAPVNDNITLGLIRSNNEVIGPRRYFIERSYLLDQSGDREFSIQLNRYDPYFDTHPSVVLYLIDQSQCSNVTDTTLINIPLYCNDYQNKNEAVQIGVQLYVNGSQLNEDGFEIETCYKKEIVTDNPSKTIEFKRKQRSFSLSFLGYDSEWSIPSLYLNDGDEVSLYRYKFNHKKPYERTQSDEEKTIFELIEEPELLTIKEGKTKYGCDILVYRRENDIYRIQYRKTLVKRAYNVDIQNGTINFVNGKMTNSSKRF